VYTYEQGLSLDRPREDGRRCLDGEVMQSKGWTQDGRGRWLDPVRVQAARESFAKLELACRFLAERRQRRDTDDLEQDSPFLQERTNKMSYAQSA
jgi:hypothetical protein